jgi:hypothetical protein
MGYVGTEYIVVLNDPQLRQGLIRGADGPCQPGRANSRGPVLRHWFALMLHALASRIEPTARTPDLQPAPGTALW